METNVIQLADRRPPTVQYVVRDVYGNPTIYPANEAGSIFAAIANKKTLNKADLVRIELLGFKLEQVSHQVHI